MEEQGEDVEVEEEQGEGVECNIFIQPKIYKCDL